METFISKMLARSIVQKIIRNIALFYFRYFPIQVGKIWVWNKLNKYFLYRFSPVIGRMIGSSKLHIDFKYFVHSSIYFNGNWEPGITKYIQNALSVGDIFVDIGANVGYYSLLASKIVKPSGKVIAFEALPVIREELKMNIELNRYDNIEIQNCGLSDRQETDTIYHMLGNSGQSSIRHDLVKSKAIPYEVAFVTFDEAVDPKYYPRIRIVKIDVEGAEYKVLKGMVNFLRNSSPKTEVICELTNSYLKQIGCKCDEVLSFMKRLGFNAYLLDDGYRNGITRYGLEFEYIPWGSKQKPLMKVDLPFKNDQENILFSKQDIQIK